MAADDIDHAALFAAYRTAFAPTHERRERVLERLRRPDARSAVLPREGDGDARVALARVIVLAIAAAVLAVLGLELANGGFEARREHDGRSEAIDEAVIDPEDGTAIERGEVLGAARRRSEPSGASIVPAEPPPSPVIPPPTIEPAPPPVVAAPMAPAMPRQIAEPETEQVLLARARAAIGRRAWQRGKQALERHAELYPEGALAEERSALRLVVDCRIEHSEAARLRARDFIVHHARSPQFGRIIEACRASASPATYAAGGVNPSDAPVELPAAE